VMSRDAALLELLERVRERIVPDVVEQSAERNDAAVDVVDGFEVAALAELVQRALCEMVDADGVIETRMRRAGIDQVCVTELFDVAKSLEYGAVDDAARDRIDADRVPERVTDGDGLCHRPDVRVEE